MHFASCCIFDNEVKSHGTRRDPADTSSPILDACLTNLGFGVAASVVVMVPFVASTAARPTAAAARQGAPRPRATVLLKQNDSASNFARF